MAKYITLAFTDKGMSGADTATAQTLFRFKTPQIASLIAVQHPDNHSRKIGIMLCHNPNGAQWHVFKYHAPRDARDPLCDSFQRAIHWRLSHLGRRAQAKRAVERRSGSSYAAPTPAPRNRSETASSSTSSSSSSSSAATTTTTRSNSISRGRGNSSDGGGGGGGTNQLRASDRIADAIGGGGYDPNRSMAIPKRTRSERRRSERRRSERRKQQYIAADPSYVEPLSGNGDPVYSELSDDVSLLGSSHGSSQLGSLQESAGSSAELQGFAGSPIDSSGADHEAERAFLFGCRTAGAGARGGAEEDASVGAGAEAGASATAGNVVNFDEDYSASPTTALLLEPKPRRQLPGRPTPWRGASSFGAAHGWGAPRANQ